MTKLSPHNDMAAMNRHINSKLGVNVNLKVVSKPGAPVLSLILDCTSESNSLNLRMPGLWPVGTCIVKCKPPPAYSNNSSQRGSGQAQGGGQNHHDSASRQNSNGRNRSASPHNRSSGHSYPYTSRDQLQLNGQWRV